MAVNRFYSNTAVLTQLTNSLNTSATSIAVGSTSGFPSSTPYTLVIDEGGAAEELVTVTNVAGLNLTVTRGSDNTPAATHSSGASVRHVVSARDFTEPQAHIAAASGVHGVTGSVVGTTDTQTLTNKTLGAGTVLPSTVVTTTGAQTVTGKDLSSGNTFPSTLVTTTDTQTVTGKDLSSGNTFPTSLVTLTGSQTLSGKTLSSPAIADFTNATHDHSAASKGGNIPIASVTGLQTALDDKVDDVVIQAGEESVTFSSSSVETVAVTFPVAFSSVPKVSVNIRSTGGPTARWVSRAGAVTTTGFTLYVASPDGSSQAWSAIPVQWIAVNP